MVAVRIGATREREAGLLGRWILSFTAITADPGSSEPVGEMEKWQGGVAEPVGCGASRRTVQVACPQESQSRQLTQSALIHQCFFLTFPELRGVKRILSSTSILGAYRSGAGMLLLGFLTKM